ncbi:glycosyltransferase [Galbibacter orientalis DSM 19592]|uniref:Glycosyltransferase n=1 Tax=Galbibacter orientalis DSM 19592 TaxID=926559 RepID=I3C789_9FLAO|nr:glycosyltransferase family 4 protein [Galbibacter orientalis]EIJ39482.1 glycosyltransferase [Galbibacter orientalis DSM 19592]
MKITFFCKTKDKTILEKNLFYVQDIDILKKIDKNLIIATKWSEIDYKSDVIFIWWWSYAIFPVIKSKLLGKKVIITGTFNYDTGSPSDYKKRPYYQKILIWISLKFASNNIFVSEREYLIFKNKFRKKNISYIPHGVYIDRYKASHERNPNVLLTISWLEQNNLKRKCVFETIRAVKILKEEGHKFKLNIVGREGDAVNDLIRFIKENQLNDEVKIFMDVTEKQKIKFLSSCSIYLQPSRYEGFGVAIAEAMSCGCPIITSKVGEVPNVVGNAAYMLDDTNPNTIAEGILKLVHNEELMQNYQIKARERVVGLFSVKRREVGIRKLLNINEFGVQS